MKLSVGQCKELLNERLQLMIKTHKVSIIKVDREDHTVVHELPVNDRRAIAALPPDYQFAKGSATEENKIFPVVSVDVRAVES